MVCMQPNFQLEEINQYVHQILQLSGVLFCHNKKHCTYCTKIYNLGESLTLQGITSLKWKREQRWFVDFKITLILHCGNEFRMEVCIFHFKFDDLVTRKGRIISSFFFGAVEKSSYWYIYNTGWIAVLSKNLS